MKIQNLSEAAIFEILVERFGRPIGESPSTVGVPDERHESRDFLRDNEKVREVSRKKPIKYDISIKKS